jgi:hypothetical protein
MKVIEIKGGLGNQMFQYAAARGTGDPFLFIDIDFLARNNTSTEHFTARNYELSIFPNINAKFLKGWKRKIIKSNLIVYRFIRRIVYGRIVKVHDLINVISPLQKNDNLFLKGYFQNEIYFQHIREILINEFTFPMLDDSNMVISRNICSTVNSVSIHVRRGDYLKPEIMRIHGVLPIEYYESAIKRIELNVDVPVYFVFSDDISWCKENLRTKGDVYFISSNTGSDSWKDMYLMSLCKHHIIANSSFSWWGAWLSKENGINIAPSKWFLDKEFDNMTKGIIPNKWVQITF